MMKRTTIFFLYLLSIVVFLSACKNCKFCNDKKLVFDTLFLGPPESPCDYIVLKKRTDKGKGVSWTDKDNKLSRIFKPVPIDDAINYIKEYNISHNPDLKNTSFVDFNSRELMIYLIEIGTWAKQEAKTTDSMRIYFAKYPTMENTMILTATTKETGDIITEESLLPVNYGGICPPPKGCQEDKKALLLIKAIERSAGRIKP